MRSQHSCCWILKLVAVEQLLCMEVLVGGSHGWAG